MADTPQFDVQALAQMMGEISSQIHDLATQNRNLQQVIS
jgi:hypothetical protein